MTRILSQEFKDFMIDLKAWVDAGCPEPTIKSAIGFHKDDSICFQTARWSKDDDQLCVIGNDLHHLLMEQFGDAGFPIQQKVHFGVGI